VAVAPAPAAPAPLLPPAIMVAKVRMETPVLYFYSPTEVAVNVKVSFKQGVMSEWYPPANAPTVSLTRPLATTVGTIEWPTVRVLPGANPVFPEGTDKSHYYAARHVDASPVGVGQQYEKFLFYRGLADFQPPLVATVGTKGDHVAMGALTASHIVLFENKHGRVGYQVVRTNGSPLTLSRPKLTGTVDALRGELESMLTAEGLYPREAKAVVETWRDSWFEEGTRIFYIIPRSSVDERLPLTISPAPVDVTRVFVGRLELITPEMKDDVERAIVANDLDALNRYGRFLDSVLLQIADRPSIAGNLDRVAKAVRAVALSHPQPTATCQ
jgi:hypothetical protein